MLVGQRVKVSKTIKPEALGTTEAEGVVVAWMQGNGPYAIVMLKGGHFVTCDLADIRCMS